MKREVMIAQLGEQFEYLRGLIAGLEESQLSRPPGSGRMSLKQMAAHIARTDEMFAERLDQMLTLDDPPVKVIDAALEDLDSYNRLDLNRVMEEFGRSRKRLIVRLSGLYPQDWERCAAHPEYHRYNVQMAIEHLLLHEAHHLYQMEQMRAAIDRWDQR
ncbi:MAG TPA: DinB family protein [Blastocatellia bacterium]|nr:DinB family protein [Blastocatellia bacterium]